MDATAEHAPLESLRWDDQGAMALRVDRQGRGTLVTVPYAAPEENRSDSKVDLVLEPDGTVAFRERWTERGIGVAALRQQYQDASRWAELLQREYDERLPGIDVEAVTIEGTQDLGPELRFDIRARVPGFASAADGALSVPSTLFPDLWGQGAAGSANRTTDLVFQGPGVRDLEIRVLPPEGFSAAALPETLRIEGPHLLYERTVRIDGKAVVVSERLVRDAARIPAEDYPEFRRAALAIDRAQAERLRFQRTAPQAPSAEREE